MSIMKNDHAFLVLVLHVALSLYVVSYSFHITPTSSFGYRKERYTRKCQGSQHRWRHLPSSGSLSGMDERREENELECREIPVQISRKELVGNQQPFVSRQSNDLTDRFKYKINALMGKFDPLGGADDEYQHGNILSAMLSFPSEYTFSAVGRTNGDGKLERNFMDGVETSISCVLGSENIDDLKFVQRGNFTRVRAKVMVDSATSIEAIYSSLGKIDQIVLVY